jgi:hypothetical protein
LQLLTTRPAPRHQMSLQQLMQTILPLPTMLLHYQS